MKYKKHQDPAETIRKPHNPRSVVQIRSRNQRSPVTSLMCKTRTILDSFKPRLRACRLERTQLPAEGAVRAFWCTNDQCENPGAVPLTTVAKP